MTDLAPRPRGGWQVGGLYGGDASTTARFRTGECYGVTRTGSGRWHIRHFTQWAHTTPCCVFDVEITEADRELARREGLAVAFITLRRGDQIGCVRRRAQEAR